MSLLFEKLLWIYQCQSWKYLGYIQMYSLSYIYVWIEKWYTCYDSLYILVSHKVQRESMCLGPLISNIKRKSSAKIRK